MLLGILEIAKSKAKPTSIAKLPKSVSFLSGKLSINNYSGTLHYGHPRKVAMYNFADTLFGLECIYICCPFGKADSHFIRSGNVPVQSTYPGPQPSLYMGLGSLSTLRTTGVSTFQGF